jgi:Nucleolar protein,Nop52
MCDRVRVQQQLAVAFAGVADHVQRETGIQFFGAFWVSLIKQWHKLDRNQ